MWDWIQAHAGWIAAVSALSFFATLAVIPILLARMPADYFLHRRRETVFAQFHPALRIVALTLKNVLGAFLVLAGLVLSLPAVPGQGVLTILIGLTQRKSPDALKLLLVDPKGTELVELADDPHLMGEIGYLASDAVEALRTSVEEMERRYLIFRSHKARSLPEYNSNADEEDRLPWWLIVLDEYADLTADADDRREIEALLKSL